MTIAEGVQVTVRYKVNSSGVIGANALADTTTIPGTTGGQLLRRVSSTLDLTRNNYAATEIRSDRQEVDFRLGTGHVAGDVSGEFSPFTYFDFIEAVHRDTRVAALVLGTSALTSVVFAASGATATFGGGDPVALGLFVGDVIRFTGDTTSVNNNKNFTILSFGGTNNRLLTLTPAPVDDAIDTTFTVTRPGKTTIVPSSGHVSRLFTFEHYGSDTDSGQLFIENRIWKYVMNMPATGLATFALSVMGRWAYDLTGATAPYFTAPAVETTTGLTAAVNGILLLNGTQIGTVTAAMITVEAAATVGEVIGQNFAAAISMGHTMVSGQVTAYLDGTTIPALFKAETECQLLLGVNTTSAGASPIVQIFLPRIKFTAATMAAQGEGLQTITAPFRALRYLGSTAGYPSTVIRIQDSEVT